jgi:purine-cytosine permease-like protein
MKYLIGFFRFWYDFIIGDCWQIAAGVAIVLAVGAWLSHSQVVPAGLVPPVVGIGVVLIVVISLLTTAKERDGKH